MVNPNLYKNTEPCFLSEGKWDGVARGILLWLAPSLGQELTFCTSVQ